MVETVTHSPERAKIFSLNLLEKGRERWNNFVQKYAVKLGGSAGFLWGLGILALASLSADIPLKVGVLFLGTTTGIGVLAGYIAKELTIFSK